MLLHVGIHQFKVMPFFYSPIFSPIWYFLIYLAYLDEKEESMKNWVSVYTCKSIMLQYALQTVLHYAVMGITGDCPLKVNLCKSLSIVCYNNYYRTYRINTLPALTLLKIVNSISYTCCMSQEPVSPSGLMERLHLHWLLI